MRTLTFALLVVASLASMLLVDSCSSAQKAEEKAAINCVGSELQQLEAIWQGSGSTADKAIQTTPAVLTCAQQIAAAKAAAQGSASSSASPAIAHPASTGK